MLTYRFFPGKKRVSKLCSTKWNASLILLRDYRELVALCKVRDWSISTGGVGRSISKCGS